MRGVLALARSARILRSGLIALMVFMVLLAQTERVAEGAIYSVPIWLICMMGYVINDLHDIEKDKENHPERPLPAGAVGTTAVATFFFLLLGLILVMVKTSMPAERALMYAAAALFVINYNYVVAFLWPLKNLYLSAIAILPIALFSTFAPHFPASLVAVAAYLHVLGAEILSDVKDRRGDGNTPAKWLGERRASIMAFGCKFAGDVVLLTGATTPQMYLVASALVVSDVALAMSWRHESLRPALLKAMLVQMFVGVGYCV